MIVKLIAALLIIFASIAAERMDILALSDSHHSLILNKGALEGVATGMRGRFILYTKKDEEPLRFVASAEAIKVHSNYSFWFLTEIDTPAALVKGEKLLFIPDTSLGAGVRDYVIGEKRVVLNDNQTTESYQREEVEGLPGEYIYGINKYQKGEQLLETELESLEDIEMYSYDSWSTGWARDLDGLGKGVRSYNMNQPLAVDKSVIAEELKQQQLTSIAKGGLEAINQQGGVGALHREAAKKQSYQNSYQVMKEKSQRKHKIETWARNKIRDEGELWSGAMDDDELREFFLRSGIANEKARRSQVLDYHLKHEVLLRYSTGIANNVTDDDLTNQGQPYELSAGYDFHLGRTAESLDRFSVELLLSTSNNYFDAGGRNVQSQQMDYSAGLNMYFYNRPTSLNKYIWYMGVGMKGGSATFSLARSQATYSYQRHFMPTAQLGLKYRFYSGEVLGDKVGFGVNLALNYEYMKFTSNEDMTSVSNVSEQVAVGDLKLSAGLCIYF